jgi:predicted aspartyl protease
MIEHRHDYPPLAARIAAIGLALAPLHASSDPASLPADAAVEEVVVSAPEPRYVAPTTRDRIGRIWAPVLLNGKGPYRLVLDTGASHSAIIQKVADELALPVKERSVRLKGVTGTAVVATAKVDSLEFGELRIDHLKLPIVAAAFGGADGVLGSDGLGDKRIVIEFRKDRITVARSHRTPAPPAYAVVPFKYNPLKGMRAEIMVGRVKAVGIIDTGSQATLGNLALRDALARSAIEGNAGDIAIEGVTEDIQFGTRVRVPNVVLGDLLLRSPRVLFSDVHIFEQWHLTKEPALLVGMDILGVLDTLVIEYKRSELHIKAR